MASQEQRAVLLDRDGVINRNRSDYCKSWSEFEFLDGALSALARLAQTGFRVIVVTNQSPVGRGMMTRAQVDDIHRQMIEQVNAAGGRIDAVYYCPHRPEAGCACRKPRPGLLLKAGKEHQLDLAASFMVGDSLEDMRAGLEAGCISLLVRTGRGEAACAQLDGWSGPQPIVVNDLAEAVEWILARE